LPPGDLGLRHSAKHGPCGGGNTGVCGRINTCFVNGAVVTMVNLDLRDVET
jgi:hypothetical protein